MQPDALTIHGAAYASIESIEADFWAELAHIQAESIGFITLDANVDLI